MAEREEITLTRTAEAPSRSLAQILKGQYTSKEFNAIFSATELREHEIIGICGAFTTRFVSMILGTHDWQKKDVVGEQKQLIEERLMIKRMILSDSNSMAFVCEDSWLYALGLCRQSLKRQSRKEAMAIAMSPRPITEAEGMGMKDRLFTKLGVSRKYRNVPIEK